MNISEPRHKIPIEKIAFISLSSNKSAIPLAGKLKMVLVKMAIEKGSFEDRKNVS